MTLGMLARLVSVGVLLGSTASLQPGVDGADGACGAASPDEELSSMLQVGRMELDKVASKLPGPPGRRPRPAPGCSTTPAAPAACPPADFSTVKDFDLNAYVTGRWYIQQQMEVVYLPRSQNRCVYADYKLESTPTPLGYNIRVQNHAEDVDPPHTDRDSDSLCAKIIDGSAGKLAVAPCNLPSFLAGPYWVLAYSAEEGYALISGGPPKISAPGGCRTGSGVNEAGLWIFTRRQTRDQAVVDKVRAIAAGKGFDLSVLNDVNQTCNRPSL